jgi:enolase-phosphatase E1
LSLPAGRQPVRGVLLDIEGTTTPIDFVYHVLFPYARARAKAFLDQHLDSSALLEDVAHLLAENLEDRQKGLDPPPLDHSTHQSRLDSLVAYIHWLMEQDRKSTPLKSLQGKIWEEGYRKSELRGQVFSDVPPALARWQGRKIQIGIFSSGSVLAQKLLFSHTEAGDLAAFIQHYFDTTTGPKGDSASYRKIAQAMGLQPEEMLFVSDVLAELDAARSAGMQTALCIRPGNRPVASLHRYPTIRSFEELFPSSTAAQD